MKRIAVIGLQYDTNLGDPIISDSLVYLLKKSGINGDLITSIDLKGRAYMGDDSHARLKSTGNRIVELFKRIKKNIWVIDWIYFYSKEGRNVKPYFQEKLKSIDAIIFAGGGIIECEHYNCYQYINLITEIAKKENIKLIYNAVGFNGSYENNAAYKRLRKCLNSDNVCYISVRENPDEMQRYVAGHKKLVCDPGCWSAEAYGVSKQAESQVIGIGLIRPEVFCDFGYEISYSQVEQLFYNILLLLQNNGYRFQLFTNGTYADFCFGEKLLRDHVDLQCDKILTPKEPRELLEILAQFRAGMCTRMHASICSYSLDIPTITLCWNEKLKHFYSGIGYLDRCIEAENFDAEYIVKKLLECYRLGSYPEMERSRVRRSILDSIEEYKNYIV